MLGKSWHYNVCWGGVETIHVHTRARKQREREREREREKEREREREREREIHTHTDTCSHSDTNSFSFSHFLSSLSHSLFLMEAREGATDCRTPPDYYEYLST
jgi:hypothetical protein